MSRFQVKFLTTAGLLMIRVAFQIRYGSNAKLLGLPSSHHERVGIVEPDGLEPAELVASGKRFLNPLINTVRALDYSYQLLGGRLQNHQQGGSGIFRIQVYLPAGKCIKTNFCATQPRKRFHL